TRHPAHPLARIWDPARSGTPPHWQALVVLAFGVSWAAVYVHDALGGGLYTGRVVLRVRRCWCVQVGAGAGGLSYGEPACAACAVGWVSLRGLHRGGLDSRRWALPSTREVAVPGVHRHGDIAREVVHVHGSGKHPRQCAVAAVLGRPGRSECGGDAVASAHLVLPSS